MKGTIIIRFAILALLAVSALLILRSSSVKKAPAVKESMDECCQKKCNIPADDNLIWETFSRQLISLGN
jgi:hypothetical protein